jgi:NAD(P)-dependent dehydrogenase (short-subunit alcohol dehydrogenase family)
MPVAVVTGAASGIGRALALELAGQGYKVHLVDIASTEELAEETGGVSALVDVSAPDQIAGLASQVGEVEFVCLNAGVVGASLGAPWEAPLEDWAALINVNLYGVINGLRAFVPSMLTARRPAHLLITASLAGLVTFPAGGAYAATKHAVVAVAEQTALALEDSPVSVTLLCPALVRTAMSPDGADPADIAKQAVAGAREGRFLVVPGEWTRPIVARAERLASGKQPTVPTPELADG